MTAKEARELMTKALEKSSNEQFNQAIRIIEHSAGEGLTHCVWYMDNLTDTTKEKLKARGYKLDNLKPKSIDIFRNPTRISWGEEAV